MICYLDFSVVLSKLLSQDHPLSSKIPWGEWDTAVSSTLLQVETFRAIDRLRRQNRLSDVEVAHLVRLFQDVLVKIGEIPVSESVLQKASMPFPTLASSLDAIHVASALLWKEKEKEDILFLTHDFQQGVAARAMGLTIEGIVIE